MRFGPHGPRRKAASQDEHGNTESERVRLESSRHDRANDRSERRPGETLPGNSERRTQGGLRNDQGQIGAQYTSGSRNNRATINDATAATAVRAECTNTRDSVPAITQHPLWRPVRRRRAWFAAKSATATGATARNGNAEAAREGEAATGKARPAKRQNIAVRIRRFCAVEVNGVTHRDVLRRACVGYRKRSTPCITMNVVVSVLPPVMTSIVRAPVEAERSMTTLAVAVVALVTLMGPAAPAAAPPTDIPAPNIHACELPFVKVMFDPLIVTVALVPAFAESGLSETDGFGGVGVLLPPLHDVRKRTNSVHMHTTDSCTKRLFTAEPQLFAMFGGGVTRTAMHAGEAVQSETMQTCSAIRSPEHVAFENKRIWERASAHGASVCTQVENYSLCIRTNRTGYSPHSGGLLLWLA